MIEIICQGKSPSEAKAKCMAAEILLTKAKISTDTVIHALNAIGGICITKREENEDD